MFKRFTSALPVKKEGDLSWLGFPEDDTREGVMSRDILMHSLSELTVTDLCLDGNGFGNNELSFLLDILAKVLEVGTVKRLALAHNILDKQGFNDLRAFLLAIPPSIQQLDLSHNRLCKSFAYDEFIQLMKAIPDTVSNVDVQRNQFEKYSNEQRQHFVDQFSDRFNVDNQTSSTYSNDI
ncbi:MAG: hypothetical protein K0U37_02975 [Gammaproteobacteria bacterium]|nr:hypothetical protein [Gammaproteobacteria bacterium]